tara:strand:- start:83 stop:442 length:360 start_codon:yes stop_codon:yes gene_type:complete
MKVLNVVSVIAIAGVLIGSGGHAQSGDHSTSISRLWPVQVTHLGEARQKWSSYGICDEFCKRQLEWERHKDSVFGNRHQLPNRRSWIPEQGGYSSYGEAEVRHHLRGYKKMFKGLKKKW